MFLVSAGYSSELTDIELAEIRVVMTNYLILQHQHELLKTQCTNLYELNEVYFEKIERQDSWWSRNKFYFGWGIGTVMTAVLFFLLK